MIARVGNIKPVFSVRVASEKTPDEERPTFFLVTGILAFAMIAFAGVCLTAVLAVFYGGVR